MAVSMSTTRIHSGLFSFPTKTYFKRKGGGEKETNKKGKKETKEKKRYVGHRTQQVWPITRLVSFLPSLVLAHLVFHPLGLT